MRSARKWTRKICGREHHQAHRRRQVEHQHQEQAVAIVVRAGALVVCAAGARRRQGRRGSMERRTSPRSAVYIRRNGVSSATNTAPCPGRSRAPCSRTFYLFRRGPIVPGPISTSTRLRLSSRQARSRTVPEAVAPKCGPLSASLRDTAEQRPIRRSRQSGAARPPGMSGTNSAQIIVATLYIAGDSAGDEEPCAAIEHAHERGGRVHEG